MMMISKLFAKCNFLVAPAISLLFGFSLQFSVYEMVILSNKTEIEEIDKSHDSCILAISISNYSDYNDYDISIWIQNNKMDGISAPFNLGSLLNKNPDMPMLNLWLVSPDGNSAYLMKRSGLIDFLHNSNYDDLIYPKTNKKGKGDIFFKFNIKDIFGENIPVHDKFFFEYIYEAEHSEELMSSSLENRNAIMEKDDFEYFIHNNYRLKEDRLIGNFYSSVAYHKDHLNNLQMM